MSKKSQQLDNVSKPERGAVVDIILGYDLLQGKGLKTNILSAMERLSSNTEKVKLNGTRWDTIVCLAEFYLKGMSAAVMDVCHVSPRSEATTRKVLKQLEAVQVVEKRLDKMDRRRSYVQLSADFQSIIDTFVETCSRDFADLIKQYDTREREEARKHLRESDARWHLIANIMPVPFSYVDKDRYFRFTNQAYQKWLNEKTDNINGRHIKDVLGDKTYEAFRSHIDKAMAGEVVQYRKWVPYKDDSERFISARYVPNIDDAGKVQGMFVLVENFTDRKLREQLFRKNEESLINAQRDLETQKIALDEHAIVSVTDVKGNIIDVNDKFCAICGYEREELIGQNHRILKSGEHSTDMYKDLWQTISNGEIWHGNIKNRTKQDGFYWVAATIVPFLDDEGKPVRYVSIRTDITDHINSENAIRRSKEELETAIIELDSSRIDLEFQASELAGLAENQNFLRKELEYEIGIKDRFFSILSHDLKSPFTSLLGMTQMMSQMADSFTKEQLVDYAGNVFSAGERVFLLLQNLLEWGQLQMQGATLEPETVSLEKLSLECIQIMAPIADEKGIRLDCDIQNIRAFADPNMVQTVIRNLMANAIKFTEQGGGVKISAEYREGKALMSVRDTGIGMTSKQMENIFSIDQKTSTPGTAGEVGTGLGLPLCKEMIERNKGKIWVESDPGEGSSFHFTLPCEEKPEKR